MSGSWRGQAKSLYSGQLAGVNSASIRSPATRRWLNQKTSEKCSAPGTLADQSAGEAEKRANGSLSQRSRLSEALCFDGRNQSCQTWTSLVPNAARLFLLQSANRNITRSAT